MGSLKVILGAFLIVPSNKIVFEEKSLSFDQFEGGKQSHFIAK